MPQKLEIPPTTEAVKKTGDTTSFSCVVFKFNLGNYQDSSSDTIGFSRMVLQFQPKTWNFGSSAHETRSFSTVLRLRLKHHSAEAGGVVAALLIIPRLKSNTTQLKLVVSPIFFTASAVGGIWTFEPKLHEARKELVKQLQIFAKWGILVALILYKRVVGLI